MSCDCLKISSKHDTSFVYRCVQFYRQQTTPKHTVMFLIHGRYVRILVRVFGVRSEDRGGPGVGGVRNRVSQLIPNYCMYQTNPFLNGPMYLTSHRLIPCIKHRMCYLSIQLHHMLTNPYSKQASYMINKPYNIKQLAVCSILRRQQKHL
jgi:hypothetical protein